MTGRTITTTTHDPHDPPATSTYATTNELLAAIDRWAGQQRRTGCTVDWLSSRRLVAHHPRRPVAATLTVSDAPAP